MMKHYIHVIVRNGDMEPMEIYSWLTPAQVQILCEGWADLQASQYMGYSRLREASEYGFVFKD